MDGGDTMKDTLALVGTFVVILLVCALLAIVQGG
jgi:hypothetical protein